VRVHARIVPAGSGATGDHPAMVNGSQMGHEAAREAPELLLLIMVSTRQEVWHSPPESANIAAVSRSGDRRPSP